MIAIALALRERRLALFAALDEKIESQLPDNILPEQIPPCASTSAWMRNEREAGEFIYNQCHTNQQCLPKRKSHARHCLPQPQPPDPIQPPEPAAVHPNQTNSLDNGLDLSYL